ncbi:diacylglycerol/polyprenol kinase family protein [Archaeoglobus sp.]
MKSELKRKAVHLTGLIVPFFYVYFSREFTLSFLIVVLAVFVILESVRLDAKLREEVKRALKLYIKVEDFERVIEEITRGHERSRIGAHIYFVVGALVVVWFFPDYAVGVIAVAVVSDALASLIGRFGRVRIGSKSLEGFLAYFVSAFLILQWLNYPLTTLIALIGALTELIGVPPDDNFSCQITMGFTAYIFKSIAF